MLGNMMNVPMLVSELVEYAGLYHSQTEVVARRLDHKIEHETWGGIRSRSKRLAKALEGIGVTRDTRIASLAWNTLNHLEVFYAVLGIGAPLHALNPRLAVHDLKYMAELMEDTICFVDAGTLELAETLAAEMSSITVWIYLDEGEEVIESSIPNLRRKTDLVASYDDDYEWPSFDENSASTICFTSGTTGRPKGVAYSHRSVTLSAMNMTMADMYSTEKTGQKIVAMPIAPMFHANAWMMPFSAPMNGHKLVLPGRAFDAPSLVELIQSEGVTVAGAVPTIISEMCEELDKRGEIWKTLDTLLIAGTRLPRGLYDCLIENGVGVRQTWGMTEVPGAARATMPPGADCLSHEEQTILNRDRQGRVAFQAMLRIVDENGERLAQDGKQSGLLQVRGATVVARYLGDPSDSAADWLDTGDVANIYGDSSLELVDRVKDVIKSGGEWISSPQLESAAMEHPSIRLAAAIPVPHPKWQERPRLLCILNQDQDVTPDELRAFMAKRVAKFWLPEDVIFVDDLAFTTTGKLDKVKIKKIYGEGSGLII